MLFPMGIPCGRPGPGCVEAGGTVSTEAGAQHRRPRPDEEAAEEMMGQSRRAAAVSGTHGAQRGWRGRGTLGRTTGSLGTLQGTLHTGVVGSLQGTLQGW